MAATKSLKEVFAETTADLTSEDLAIGGASDDILEAETSEVEIVAEAAAEILETETQDATAETVEEIAPLAEIPAVTDAEKPTFDDQAKAEQVKPVKAKDKKQQKPSKDNAKSDPKKQKAADEAISEQQSEPSSEGNEIAAKADETVLEQEPISEHKDTSIEVNAVADATDNAVEHNQVTAPDDLASLDDTEFEDSLAAALGEEKRLAPETAEANTVNIQETETNTDSRADFEDALASALGEDDSETEKKITSSEERKPRVHVIKMAKVEAEAALDDQDPSDDLDAELANILNDDINSLAETAAETEGDDTTYVLGHDVAVSDVDPDEITEAISDEASPLSITPRRIKATSDTAQQRSDSLLRHERQDVSRLMQETDEKLSNPASNRRRSALAHLRAAVAATMADKSIETSGRKDDNSDAYREDLATVVRPRRPDTRKLRSEIDEPSKTTPLRLVAEQRVDAVDDIKDATPAQVAQVSGDPNPEEFETFEE